MFLLIKQAFCNFLIWLNFVTLLLLICRPFPSSTNRHFQNEAKCKHFVVKMSFICVRIKTNFHINSFALYLAWKKT